MRFRLWRMKRWTKKKRKQLAEYEAWQSELDRGTGLW